MLFTVYYGTLVRDIYVVHSLLWRLGKGYICCSQFTMAPWQGIYMLFTVYYGALARDIYVAHSLLWRLGKGYICCSQFTMAPWQGIYMLFTVYYGTLAGAVHAQCNSKLSIIHVHCNEVLLYFGFMEY